MNIDDTSFDLGIVVPYVQRYWKFLIPWTFTPPNAMNWRYFYKEQDTWQNQPLRATLLSFLAVVIWTSGEQDDGPTERRDTIPVCGCFGHEQADSWHGAFLCMFPYLLDVWCCPAVSSSGCSQWSCFGVRRRGRWLYGDRGCPVSQSGECEGEPWGAVKSEGRCRRNSRGRSWPGAFRRSWLRRRAGQSVSTDTL